jgi:hypothetical protein
MSDIRIETEDLGHRMDRFIDNRKIRDIDSLKQGAEIERACNGFNLQRSGLIHKENTVSQIELLIVLFEARDEVFNSTRSRKTTQVVTSSKIRCQEVHLLVRRRSTEVLQVLCWNLKTRKNILRPIAGELRMRENDRLSNLNSIRTQNFKSSILKRKTDLEHQNQKILEKRVLTR